VAIEWTSECCHKPVLRRSVRDETGSVGTSPTLAAQFSQIAAWNRRLGRSFGMEEPFECKMLRRGASEAITSEYLLPLGGHGF
jgi:hypothetical protein